MVKNQSVKEIQVNNQHTKDILVAIASVRRRLELAMADGDTIQANKLAEDLMSLKLCLEYEAQKLVDAIDSQAGDGLGDPWDPMAISA